LLEIYGRRESKFGDAQVAAVAAAKAGIVAEDQVTVSGHGQQFLAI
jgi:hypothetical protein